MDLGIGTLGLMPWEFWQLTFADLIRLKESFIHRQNQEWDRVRYLATSNYNTAFGAKKQLKPQDLFKLPHDNIDVTNWEPPSQKDMIDIFKKDMQNLKRKPL